MPTVTELPEKTCKCGMRYKLEVEHINGPSAIPWYSHCELDEGEYVPGAPVALWELRDGQWIRVK